MIPLATKFNRNKGFKRKFSVRLTDVKEDVTVSEGKACKAAKVGGTSEVGFNLFASKTDAGSGIG